MKKLLLTNNTKALEKAREGQNNITVGHELSKQYKVSHTSG